MAWEGRSHAFVQSPRLSQVELAAAVLKAYPHASCQQFVYCHQTFPEDLHICPAAWLQHITGIRASETFTVEYQGGATWGLAFQETIDWVQSQSASATSLIVGAERVLAPAHRAFSPLGWLSDAAGVVSVSTDIPSEGPTYVYEDCIAYYHPHPFAWADHAWDMMLDDTMTQLTHFFRQHPPTCSQVIYPACAPLVLEQFSHVRTGMAWHNGCCGMAHGLEILAMLAKSDMPNNTRCLCLFIEPGEVIIGLTLRRLQ